MIGMFQSVTDFIFGRSDTKMTRRQREVEHYLAQSVDRADLERRERELTRKGIF